jgi:hypothetical protein
VQGPTHEHGVRDGLTLEVNSLATGVIENLSNKVEALGYRLYVITITEDFCGSDQVPDLSLPRSLRLRRSRVTAVTDRSRVDRSN